MPGLDGHRHPHPHLLSWRRHHPRLPRQLEDFLGQARLRPLRRRRLRPLLAIAYWKNSILGKGHHAAEDALWWILGKMLIHFWKFITVAFLILPWFAENLPYFAKDVDLSLGYTVTDDIEREIPSEPMNLIAAYMLHALAGTQSMGKLLHACKNVRNMDKFLHENAAPSGGTQPILTRETISYAISLSISCVRFHANNDTSKGKASAAYERAMEHFNRLLECDWHNLLRDLQIEYVT
jgi:hypothetical protein